MKTGWISLILLLIFAFGCAPSQAGGQEEDLAQSTPLAPPSQETLSTPLSDLPQGDPTAMTPTTPAGTGLQSLVEKAKEDLAQRLNIVLTEISLLEAKAVVWPDASIGCPRPGMRYKQVPEDGAMIVLQAGGIKYEYHNGGSRGLFLCEKAYKEPTPQAQIDILNLTPTNPEAPTPDSGIPPGEGQ